MRIKVSGSANSSNEKKVTSSLGCDADTDIGIHHSPNQKALLPSKTIVFILIFRGGDGLTCSLPLLFDSELESPWGGAV